MTAAAGSRPRAVLATVGSRLRPHPHRGDVIAAGAVPLAVFAIVVELRMTQWSLGARFVVVGLISSLLLAMGWLAELEHEGPRPYHSVLLLAGLLPLAVALALLAEILGAARPPGSGGETWVFGAEALIAVAAARRANSGACTLVAALAAAISVEAFVAWVFKPHGPGTFRALLLVLTLAFAAGTLRLRDSRRRHAVQLLNAAAVLTLILGASFLVQTVLSDALRAPGLGSGFGSGPGSGFGGPVPVSGGAGFGWKLWILAVGFGLIAYAGADREPGPAYFGVVLLAEFALLVGLPVADRGSLVGWPLFLLLIGALGLAIGLRPRRPLPPPPTRAEPAPTIPLDREEHD